MNRNDTIKEIRQRLREMLDPAAGLAQLADEMTPAEQERVLRILRIGEALAAGDTEQARALLKPAATVRIVFYR